MNKARRKKLSDLIDLLTQVSEELCDLANDEQEAYDNLPESFQVPDREDEMEQVVEALNDASASINDVIESISEYSL